MADDLDHMLARLAQAPARSCLDGFEDSVLVSVAARREQLRTSKALVPVRAASIGLALAVGVAAGGMAVATTASQPRHSDTFSTASHLAPSALLEGAG